MNNFVAEKIEKFKSFFDKRRTLGIVLFFSSIGFLAILNLLFSTVFPAINISDYNFNDYVLSFVNPYKYITFIKYGIFLLTLAIVAVSGYYIFKNDSIIEKIHLRYSVVPFLIVYNLLILFINSDKIYKIIILFLLLFVIVISCFKIDFCKFQISDKAKNVLFVVFSFVVIMQFFSIFYPFIFQKVKIINEFYDIPEITLINTDKGKQEVDNIDFINKHHINGLQSKYDIRKSNATLYVPSIPFKYSKRLDDFLQRQSYYVNLYHLPDHNNNANDNYIYYNNGRLYFIGQISDSQKASLKKIASSYKEKESLNNIQTEMNNVLEDIYYFRNDARNKQLGEYLVYKKFIKNNKFEIHWQILNRYYIHHQNHLYAPVNELLLGKNFDDVFSQYGKMNALVLSKILDKLGGFDFSKYMSVSYSFYYIYVALFAVMVFGFFKRKDYILSWLLLTVASFNFTTDEFLRIAPGANPLRHFFDIFVLMFLYLYLRKKQKIFLILTEMAVLLAVLNESMTGMFILLSVTGALFVKNFIFDKKNYFEIITLIVSLPLGYFVKLAGENKVDYAAGYFLSGLLGFPTPKTAMLVFAVLIALGYVVLLKQFLNKDEKKPVIYFYVTAFFYAQALLFYYMWGSDFNHLLVYFPIFSFVILAYLFDSNLKTKYPKIHTTLISSILVFSVGFYIVSLCKYYPNLYLFNKIFRTHKVYEWTLPHTNFVSTMNPKYFEDSVKLVQKYSKDNGIYIVSKYDSFIPVISGKYSNMPYIEVSNFLTSKKEIDNNIKVLKTAKPEYLFVDKDIDRDFAHDILYNEYEFNHLFHESVWRYQRLLLMRDVFNSVRNDYEPLESSYLLTVWKRKK